MDIGVVGRWMMAVGALVFIIGAILLLTNKFGLPLGRLPGDIRIEGENFTFYFPLVTSIIISLGLSLILNLLGRLLKR